LRTRLFSQLTPIITDYLPSLRNRPDGSHCGHRDICWYIAEDHWQHRVGRIVQTSGLAKVSARVVVIQRVVTTVCIGICPTSVKWTEAVGRIEPHEYWVETPVSIAQQIAPQRGLMQLTGETEPRSCGIGLMIIAVRRVLVSSGIAQHNAAQMITDQGQAFSLTGPRSWPIHFENSKIVAGLSKFANAAAPDNWQNC
jgi:hypothetical protein